MCDRRTQTHRDVASPPRLHNREVILDRQIDELSRHGKFGLGIETKIADLRISSLGVHNLAPPSDKVYGRLGMTKEQVKEIWTELEPILNSAVVQASL